MKKSFLVSIFFFLFIGFCFGQETGNSKIKVTGASDTSKYYYLAGFYLAIPEISKKNGFQLKNSEEFFYIGTENFMTIQNIDTVYKEFDKNFKCYTLTFKFNADGKKELLDFTMKYQGQKIGLLLDNELVSVATISSPIGSGMMTLAGKFTEIQIDNLKLDIERAAMHIRLRGSTIRRKH